MALETERINVRSYGEARYWKAFMLWRLGEFNAELRVNEPLPLHRAYQVDLGRAAQMRDEVTAVLRGAGLALSRSSRYD